MPDPYTQQIIGAGQIDDRIRLLMQSMQRARELQNAPSARGMSVGGTYVASSPLEHLAAAMSRYRGGKRAKDIEAEIAQLSANRPGSAMAPSEWGAPAGLTREEAIKAGWVNRARPLGAAGSSPLGRLMAERDALPPNDPRREAYDRAIEMETTRNPGEPSFTPLQTGEGYISFDRRSGKVSPISAGKPPAADPELQGQLAAEKAKGAAAGEAVGKASADLPRLEGQAEETLRLTEDLLNHPGFKQAVGTSSLLHVQKIPGTDARDFEIRLNQLRGKQFLEAFNSLKGGGQITEAEGRKATEAMARMELSASEPEFVRAVRDFQAVVRAGLERARQKAAGGAGPPTAAPRDVAPPAGGYPRATVNGRTYEKRADGWYEVQ